MCGVLFSISDNYSFEEYFHSALLNTHHRGPDNLQFNKYNFNNFEILLGSNRLNIVDNNKKSNMPFIIKKVIP